MSETVIRVDHLSKLYQLGTIGTGSLRQDLQHWWTTRIRKRELPFFQDPNLAHLNPDQSYLWALKEVSFEVKQGEVWGIVGRNGSGKSTLLKIISRIIRPTRGAVHGIGRLSSLLEVGAGFQPELTGRENIYLSGYILGMNRREIKACFDEIVEFSGLGTFIDTPVKRYSSGMYVRLAFAVAAHLDTDILIADEVLAVGDADFQKKSLLKMKEFARQEGKTILFVSHNLQAVSHLCQQGLWLQNGQVMEAGPIGQVLHRYGSFEMINQLYRTWPRPEAAPGCDWVRIKSLEIFPNAPEPDRPIDVRTPLAFRFQLWVMEDRLKLLVGVQLLTRDGTCVFDLLSGFQEYRHGLLRGECVIPGNFLNDGSYFLSFIVYRDNYETYYKHEGGLSFEVEDYRDESFQFSGKWAGAIRPRFPIRMMQEEIIEVVS
ncbi:ABC transporter ATP-binding protein [Larkinella soli]|uniref:ABC transporter ATP-binding protein n=1 Tax=Larkinella soli TaxID=1770527 RepID=UPI000FFBA37A|nr:ABC transporter ATP-binding protein [Larkinella soli]